MHEVRENKKDITREPQERGAEVVTINERIAALQAQQEMLRNLFANLHILETQAPRTFERMRQLTRHPEKIDRYLAIHAVRSRINRAIDHLNTLVPEGMRPLGTRLDASMEKMHRVVELARKHKANIQREALGVVVPYEQHVGAELQQSIGEYLQGWDRDRQSLLSSVESAVGRWTRMLQSFEHLGLVESANANELERRSLKNMQAFVAEFVDYQGRKGHSLEDVEKEIADATVKEGQGLVMAYYKRPEDIAKILEEGRLRNLFELDASEQESQKKSNRTLQEVSRDRSAIESALGWTEGLSVYHLTVENVLDESLGEGAHTNYGSVRLVFNYDGLKGDSTFTVGDSLNDVGVPTALRSVMGRQKLESAIHRQVAESYVPMAKALLRLASEDDQDRFRMATRYIEAQVGGISGETLLGRVEEVVIREQELLNEQRSMGAARLGENARSLARIEAYCVEKGIPMRRIP